MDDVARGVAVLFPSRSSSRPWVGLCPLPTVREESASEDEDERESVGSRAPGTETDVLSDTPAHGPGRVTTDPSLQDLGTASRQLGSADDVTFVLSRGVCIGNWRRSRRCSRIVTSRWITKMSSNGYWAGCDVESYRPG